MITTGKFGAVSFAVLSSGLERSFRDVHNACQSRCHGKRKSGFSISNHLGYLERGNRAQTAWHQQDVSGHLSEKCQLVLGRLPICRSLEVPGEASCQPKVSVQSLFSDTRQSQQLPFSDAPRLSGLVLQAQPVLLLGSNIHTWGSDYSPPSTHR